MPTHVAGQIRVGSQAENFLGPGATYSSLYKAVGGIPAPEGRYKIQLFSIRRTQAYSHDFNWGSVDLSGDLLDFDDADAVADYFRSVLLAISDLDYIGVNQAVIHIMVDGQTAIMLDHFGALIEGMETLGDEE